MVWFCVHTSDLAIGRMVKIKAQQIGRFITLQSIKPLKIDPWEDPNYSLQLAYPDIAEGQRQGMVLEADEAAVGSVLDPRVIQAQLVDDFPV